MSSTKKGSTAAGRLALFTAALNYAKDLGRADPLDVNQILGRVVRAVNGVGDFPEDDRKLVKLSAAAVAFYREVRRICAGPVELDLREEEVLQAVLQHLREAGN